MDRYVYFVQGELTQHIKIGIAWEPEKRLIDLQVGSPDKLKILLAFRTTHSAQTTERHLHQRFWLYHLHGEWFKPGPELLQFIKECQDHITQMGADKELIYTSYAPKHRRFGPEYQAPKKRQQSVAVSERRKIRAAASLVESKAKAKAKTEEAKARRIASAQAAIAKRQAYTVQTPAPPLGGMTE